MAISKNAIKVTGGDLNGYRDTRGFSTNLNSYMVSFYRAMYNAYKNNIGKETSSGNEITDKMVETIKNRMLQLMGSR